ncbi:VOC family protein [Pedobacter sp. HMF7647]|uniref:VOC family protein n=1 Tax=Hufsiella arboris TaxID=2695275 RepID=A0A7K1Y6P3_9SPHI|nr:VOC family protein [Hufsiella arboris]MXV50242.1 VOC family protein [Hufsiella arboris]
MKFGKFKWVDLTVENAEEVKEFYCQVIGWKSNEMDMGGYADYLISNERSAEPVTGICHKKGTNEKLPSQWLNYVTVEDLQTALKKCTDLGEKQLTEIKGCGPGMAFSVIQDPGGAYLALMEEKESQA